MANQHRVFVVGRDAPTEEEVMTLAIAAFGPGNVIRGERILHKPSCIRYREAIVTDIDCDCPREIIYRSVEGLKSILHAAK
jgi:hypothetical protein